MGGRIGRHLLGVALSVVVHPLDLSGHRGVARPSVAQAVASVLRDRILSGRLADGESLRPLDELVDEFGASKPTIRRGLQILEAEGLLSMRRGRLGGAVVHRPRPVNAAYSMELLLRWGDVPSEDMSDALRQIEPLCAGMCATRADRAETVVPALRSVQAEGRAVVDDPDRWPAASRRFHEVLVEQCGNHTMTMLVGALESVCTRRATAWAVEGVDSPDFPVRNPAFRHRGYDDHALILTFIERGDTEAAVREAQRHLQWVPDYSVESHGD
jgi:GntR family transcriptional regulator, transcriptional repressor for pyruvate dehydrogenase complex